MKGKSKSQDTITVQPKLGDNYDSMEFTLATDSTNYDVRANVSGAFVNFDYYTTINIRSSQNLTIRFNSSSNGAITVVSGRPFELDDQMKIDQIFITNASGKTASIYILGLKKGE
jgi:hypothetical protein